MTGQPDAAVTVVVPVRNSRRTIAACLQSIVDCVPADRRQIVVVDNGSTDDTLEIVKRFPVESFVIAGRRWVSDSRNLGARKARHGLIAFVDSDCTVSPGWFETLSTSLRDRHIGIVGSKYEPRDHLSWVELAWNRAHGSRGCVPHDVEYVPGGNLAIRRETFEAVGSFSTAVETGEDMDLCQRVAGAGYRVVQDARMVCVHAGEPRTLLAVFKRNRWHGRGARIRYPNGRLSPVIVSTVLFAVALFGSVIALAAALRTGLWPPVATWFLPAIVPGVYAARYARPPRASHFVQLWIIYVAYFLGRACALPAVARASLRSLAGGPKPHGMPRRPEVELRDLAGR